MALGLGQIGLILVDLGLELQNNRINGHGSRLPLMRGHEPPKGWANLRRASVLIARARGHGLEVAGHGQALPIQPHRAAVGNDHALHEGGGSLTSPSFFFEPVALGSIP